MFVITTAKQRVNEGLISMDVFTPSFDEWIKTNSIPGSDEGGVWADHLFMTMVARTLSRDLVVIHRDPTSVQTGDGENGLFTWIRGNIPP